MNKNCNKMQEYKIKNLSGVKNVDITPELVDALKKFKQECNIKYTNITLNKAILKIIIPLGYNRHNLDLPLLKI